MTINQRISAHFFSIFIGFCIIITLFMIRYEKGNAIDKLSGTMDIYADMIAYDENRQDIGY